MAYRVSISSGNASDSTIWGGVSNSPTIHLSTNISINSAATATSAVFTAPSTSYGCLGALVHVVSNASSGTVSLVLQEYNGSSWVTKATSSAVNCSAQSVNSRPVKWMMFRFASAYNYTTTTAGYYRFQLVRNTGSGTISLAADSAGTAFSYIAVDNRVAALSATDDFIICGYNRATTITVTNDGAWTLGGGLSTARPDVNLTRIVTCAMMVCSDGVLQASTTATSSMSCKGHFLVCNNASYLCGASGSPLSGSYTHTLTMVHTATLDYCIMFDQNASTKFYGAEKTYWRTKYASGAGTAASPLVLSDPVDWSVGDQIIVGSSNAKSDSVCKFIRTKIDAYTYTLAATSGGAESGLTATYNSNAWVCNMQRNILFTSNGASLYTAFFDGTYGTSGVAQVNKASLALLACQWVRFERFNGNTTTGYGSFMAGCDIDYCVFADSQASAGYAGIGCFMGSSGIATTLNCLLYVGSTADGVYQGNGLDIRYVTYYTANDCMVFKCNLGTALYTAELTLNRLICISCNQGIVPTSYTLYPVIVDCEAHACQDGIIANFVGCEMVRGEFGTKGKNVDGDLRGGYNVFDSTMKFLSTNFGSDTRMRLNHQAYPKSWYFLDSVNGTDANEYYDAFGRWVTSGSTVVGSPDTTTSPATMYYEVPSLGTTGFKIYAAADITIQNAAYYAGTYALPSFAVSCDFGATTNTATASANTSLQKLEVFATPSTSNSTTTLTFSIRTNAASPNNRITISSLFSNIRSIGYRFVDLDFDPCYKPLKSPVFSLSVPTTDPLWVETNSTTLAGWSSKFTVDHVSQTVTVISDATLQELYDYSHYLLTLDANRKYAEWFTTTDGSRFASAYSIVVDNCNLTGAYVDVGSNALTLSGTGYFSGIVKTSSSTSVHIKLSGLISGSTVQIYNTTDSAEIYKGVVSSASFDQLFSWSSDKNIRVRVRKKEYIPYESTGSITNSGYSLNVVQVLDSVYAANGIDGSTVTEFSLVEGVVQIYISDGDNQTSAQRMFNWYKYAISTDVFIDDQSNLITANTPWSYTLDDSLLLYNSNTTPLFIVGANINNASNTGQVVDTDGGSIIINGYFPFSANSDVANAVWSDSRGVSVKNNTGIIPALL